MDNKLYNQEEIDIDIDIAIAMSLEVEVKPDLLKKYNLDQLIENGKNIIFSKYDKKHVMYMFYVIVNSIPLIKIGYTEDIAERTKQLNNEHDKQYLIFLKEIKGQSEEKNFHTMIKSITPQLQKSIKIKGKTKEEYYELCDKIIDEYLHYKNVEQINIIPVNNNEQLKPIIKLEKVQNNQNINKKRLTIEEGISIYLEWCNQHQKKPNYRSGDATEKKIGNWLKDRKQCLKTYSEVIQNKLTNLPYW